MRQKAVTNRWSPIFSQARLVHWCLGTDDWCLVKTQSFLPPYLTAKRKQATLCTPNPDLSTFMVSNWLVQLSDRNPQLLREVKGRMTHRNVLVTVATSLLVQFLLLIYHWRMAHLQILPKWISTNSDWWHQSETMKAMILWRGWCLDIFNTLTWLTFLLLLGLGSYLLLKDLMTEERRGTLVFVRLSPTSSQSVLMGKLLGVPSLLYLAIALMLPLHVWAAVNAGVPLIVMVSLSLFIVAASSFTYAFAMLHGLSWGAKAQFWYLLLPVGILCLLSFGPYWYWGDNYREVLQQNWNESQAGNDTFCWWAGSWSLFLLLAAVCLWRVNLYLFRPPPLKL